MALFPFFLSVLLVYWPSTCRGVIHDQKRFKVLDVDEHGNLYLYKTSILCKSEIIDKLTNGTYQLAKHTALGLFREAPAKNCQEIKLKGSCVPSGLYWIDPDGGSNTNAFQAYCDQETDGGGWTLVWSYTFTAYPSFNSGGNAISPRPSWSVSAANTRVSVTPPMSETHFEALEFGLWRTIGTQFLIKSNINNWITCEEGKGSLVQFKEGSVSCKIVKQISDKCAGRVPRSIHLNNNGLYISGDSLYYYFDGSTGNNWPTHDPCGTNHPNQLKEVANPHGNIFVR